MGETKEYEKTLKQVQNLKKGDLFKVVLTPDSEKVQYVSLEFSEDNRITSMGWNSGRGLFYGQVIARGSVADVVIYRVTSFDDNGTPVLDTSRRYIYRAMSRAIPYIYDKKKDIIRVGQSDDIKVGDWVLIHARYSQYKGAVIYRDGEEER